MSLRRRCAVVVGVVVGCLWMASCDGPAVKQPGPAAGGGAKLAVEKSVYGALPDGRQVDLYTLTNANGMRVRLTNYGAITVGVEVTLDDTIYTLARNNGENHLHGGLKGFDKVLWDAEAVRSDDAVGVKFTYLSKDGEEGYPGNLKVTAVHRLTNDNEFEIRFSATTDKPTIVNLAHHSYWNLAGPAAGDVLGHKLMLAADAYTPVDAGLIPTGEIRPVEGTPMDFTRPAAIGSRIARVKGGYDHNFVLRGQDGKLALAARIVEPRSGRVMTIFTDQPGVQFYTGNFLNGSVRGKGGVAYGKHYGFCLETQHYPDSPNRKSFPSVVLRPGRTYRHTMVHRFGTE